MKPSTSHTQACSTQNSDSPHFCIFAVGYKGETALCGRSEKFARRAWERRAGRSLRGITIGSFAPRSLPTNLLSFLRRCLQQVWDLAFAWQREEPPTHHAALPWQVQQQLSWCRSPGAGCTSLVLLPLAGAAWPASARFSKLVGATSSCFRLILVKLPRRFIC